MPKDLTRRFNWSAPYPANAVYNLATPAAAGWTFRGNHWPKLVSRSRKQNSKIDPRISTCDVFVQNCAGDSVA
jgi:hypothetical protein